MSALRSILLLLLLSATVFSAKKIEWTKELPSGWVLNNGDALELPIDEYTTLSSAIFNPSEPATNVIIPKLQVVSEAKSTQASNMQSCSVAYQSSTYSVFSCNKKLIRIEKNGNFMTIKEDARFIDLVTAGNEYIIALDEKATFCTDMLMTNGRFYVSCQESSNAAAKPTYVFWAAESVIINATSINENEKKLGVTSCDTKTNKGDSKMATVMTNNTNKLPVIFYDVSKVSSTKTGDMEVTYCNLAISSSGTISPVQSPNLYEIRKDEKLAKGVLRFIASISNTDLLAFIAVEESATDKKLYVVPYKIDDNGNITNSTLAYWSYDGKDVAEGWNPRYLTFTKATNDEFLASDKTNLYKFKLELNSTAVTSTAPVWKTLVDCGVATQEGVYISRVEINGAENKIDDPVSRTLIVYSVDKKAQEFAVHFDGSRFGCSRATKAADSSKLKIVNTVSFEDANNIYVTADDMISKTKLNYNTILSVKVGAETKDKEITINVAMDGYDSPTNKKFTYTTLKNALDYNKVDLQTTSFKAYKGTKFVLPIRSSSFIGNNPSFSTPSNLNVVSRYATAFNQKLGINLDGYTIHRIIAVDRDTFLAVVRKTGAPEAFFRFFATWDGEKLTNIEYSTNKTDLAKDQVVFKTVKVGNDVFCVIFKSMDTSVAKLTLTCYEDNNYGGIKDGIEKKKITDRFEVSDIQIMETANRVDIFMIGTDNKLSESGLFHYYIDIDSTGKVRTPEDSYVKKIDIYNGLSGYYPTDVMFDYWGDSESTSYLTIKMVSQSNLKPSINKFSVIFDGSNQPIVKFVYSVRLPSKDLAFCSVKNEIFFYTPKKREILIHRMIKTPSGITLPQNDLYFPVKEFNVKYLQQFNCVPEKGIFQVLGVAADKKKFLITYRGGESTNAARRVHSVVSVPSNVDFIESGNAEDYIVTVASSPGAADIDRTFVFIYNDGPIFIVDNARADASYDLKIQSKVGAEMTKDGIIKVDVITPTLSAKVEPINKFELTPGKTIFLDQDAKIDGPVMDIKVEGSDADKVKVTSRNNKNKGYTGGETSTPDRVYTENDFMASVWIGRKVKIYSDPALIKSGNITSPNIVEELTANVKEVAMTKYGTTGTEAILVVRSFSNTEYTYSIYHLSRTKAGDQYIYTKVLSADLYKTNMDYDSLQVVNIGDKDVIMAIKVKRSFNSNYIRLISFSRETGNAFKFKSSTILTTDANSDMGGHSLTTHGTDRVGVVAFYKGVPGLIYAYWDGVNAVSVSNFKQSITKFKFSDSDIKDLTLGYLRAWPMGNGKVELYVDSEGVVDYIFDMIVELDPKVGVDPIQSLTKTKEFEMPPNFDLHRTCMGKEHYGFLLKRSSFWTKPATRILQGSTIDKFTDCDNIILIYKPTQTRFIYTGLTCSEWGNAPDVDFAMVYDTNEYVFMTRKPAPQTKRVLQTSTADVITSNTISPIMVTVNAQVNPQNVKFTFVGLNGQSAIDDNPKLTLDQFLQGKAPEAAPVESGSSFWTWFIIILIILLVIGGGVYAFIWYKNSQSSEATSSYTKQAGRDTSKSDLEDTRL